MKAYSVTAEEYARLFPEGTPGTHLYNSVPFCELMAHVAEDVSYVVVGDTKPRAGIVLGKRDGVLKSPFSAPFGGLSFVKEPSVEQVFEAVRAIAESVGASDMEITLPPTCYFPTLIPKVEAALSNCGRYRGEVDDISYHYPLEQVLRYEDYMDHSARKNLHRAQEAGFQTLVLDSKDEKDVARVYNVIRANRESHGYPLRMTLQQVIDTVPVASTLFMVMTLDGEDVAAAQVQRVTEDVAQVVYWGDAPGYSHLRPMNYFALEVMRKCYGMGYKTLDIGPSSEDGVPSYGLCRFKESIGCLVAVKRRFRL